MGALKDFQGSHGADWSRIVGTPAFAAALALAHKELLDPITHLTDDEIATRGTVILADLRGNLRHETMLLGLHERKEFAFGQLPGEEYYPPDKEALEEAERGERGEEDDGGLSGPLPGPNLTDIFGATKTVRHKGPKISIAKSKPPKRKKKR